VVEGINDMRLDQLTQKFEVHDKARIYVWNAFDGNPEFKIMAMPVLIGAFAKYFPVFFVGPFRAPEFVGGIEGFSAGDICCFHDKSLITMQS
jgi:hypothetical protein